jgi:hypothetical protein
MKRKITKHDRMVDRRNALKGTAKYAKMNPGARKASYHRKTPKWGFEGKSPNTRRRKYTRKNG